MRGVTERGSDPSGQLGISTHTPHAGRDLGEDVLDLLAIISTHTPHAGRDRNTAYNADPDGDFYSHAPCGA